MDIMISLCPPPLNSLNKLPETLWVFSWLAGREDLLREVTTGLNL